MDGLKDRKFKQYMISGVTVEVIDQLIDRRKKEQKYEQTLLKWSLSLFVVIFFTFLYVYFYKLRLVQQSFFSTKGMFEFIIQDKLLLVMTVAGLTCLIQLFAYKKKHQKAENEYEELRKTTIERGEELWEKPVPWKHRHEVFDWLKNEHDINLYHK
ncbi:YpbF family protein [Pseudalkalibacillus decolorationis]|uniref:YpbF family protein n=1 Tax=Pseudalkalibacillus decolorationis TaxID=163879 RepID=UPI0021487C9C|nr:YpbF family protein [Pseudalkalibacillus decolorationis]